MRIESVNNNKGVEWVVLDDSGVPYQLAADGKLFDRFATKAKAIEVMREAEDFARFQAIRDWLTGAGCHQSCARTLAFNVVESERGRTLDAVPECGGVACGECIPCGEATKRTFTTCAHPETCYARMRRLWKQAPLGKLSKIETTMREAA